MEVKYPCISSTKCSAVIITLNKGAYHFDLYGAAGGGDGSVHNYFKGGYGGHTPGIYTILSIREQLYLYIGGKGESAIDSAKGGFNGYTDIRKNSNPKSFIVIAGGGGGAGRYTRGEECNAHGGNGGGTIGSDSGFGISDGRTGKGATKTSGGTSKTFNI